MKNLKKLLLLFVIVVLFASCDNLLEEDLNETYVEVHYIDVGQGDSILIKTSFGNMLIDAGENNKGELVLDYLKNQKIDVLDYVVATHPHSDHIGGLDVVINGINVNNVLMPNAIHTSKTFEDLLLAIKNKNIKPKYAKAPDKFNIGELQFTILNPIRDSYDELNNYSVVLKMVYKDNSFLFASDAEKLVENDILKNGYDVSAQIYKVAHHGSTTSNIEAFIKAINPKYAIISVAANNDYGHPHKEIVELFNKLKIPILSTDKEGTIVLKTDGQTISYNNNPIVVSSNINEAEKVYIDENGQGLIKGNINSKGDKIYHMPEGAYYSQTKAEVYFKTESEATQNGYRRSSR